MVHLYDKLNLVIYLKYTYCAKEIIYRTSGSPCHLAARISFLILQIYLRLQQPTVYLVGRKVL